MSAADAFDDATIDKLKLAAEEVAWLTGRGYPLAVASDLVAGHHALGEAQRNALATGTCSEPQYRRRAARELEPEDVAKRPLAVDAADVVAAVEAALAGRPLLQTLDGTVRALEVADAAWEPGPKTDEAVARVVIAAKELRPRVLRMLVDERNRHATELSQRISARVKAEKSKAEVVIVADVRVQMRREPQIATSDADLLDACTAWFNLAGRIVSAIGGARIVRLQ